MDKSRDMLQQALIPITNATGQAQYHRHTAVRHAPILVREAPKLDTMDIFAEDSVIERSRMAIRRHGTGGRWLESPWLGRLKNGQDDSNQEGWSSDEEDGLVVAKSTSAAATTTQAIRRIQMCHRPSRSSF